MLIGSFFFQTFSVVLVQSLIEVLHGRNSTFFMQNIYIVPAMQHGLCAKPLLSKGRPVAAWTHFVIGINQACAELCWENATLSLFCKYLAVHGLYCQDLRLVFSQQVPCPRLIESIYLGPWYKEKWCPNEHALGWTATCLKLKTCGSLKLLYTWMLHVLASPDLGSVVQVPKNSCRGD